MNYYIIFTQPNYKYFSHVHYIRLMDLHGKLSQSYMFLAAIYITSSNIYYQQ